MYNAAQHPKWEGKRQKCLVMIIIEKKSVRKILKLKMFEKWKNKSKEKHQKDQTNQKSLKIKRNKSLADIFTWWLIFWFINNYSLMIGTCSFKSIFVYSFQRQGEGCIHVWCWSINTC